ncbi:MAG: DNA repair protein RecO [Candidatus Kapabacteria bacterium]|nr:DNA repair protein RecO [Candidatus Kapabacteria bacterium]
MIVNTEAIILKSIKFGDTSIISHIYTKSDGKISIIAKGARSSKSKFLGLLEPMNYLSVSFYKKSQKDLHTLSDAEKIIDFHKISTSLNHLTCGLMFVESLNQTQEAYESNSLVFDLSINYLILLNKLPPNPFSFFINSQIQLLKLIGYEFYLKSDLTNIKQKCYISFENGSLSNDRASIHHIKFDKDTYKKLKEISEKDMENCSDIITTEREFNEIANFLVNYFRFHLDKNFFYTSMFLLK